ncbi:MAG: hypothetical protein QOJ90_419 [Actinomycetota bacterium]|jgi:hypothetical protein|nr:hypothetical protein [Actinomycetota bacterium]
MQDLPPLADLTATRLSLHQVAEHVLAAARKRATGEIGLLAAPGGFATPPLPDGRVIGVRGTDIVVTGPTGASDRPLTTVRAAAQFAGVEPGFPWTKHPPSTPLEPDAGLHVDPRAAGVIADWFALGAASLGLLATELAEQEPSEAWIWPEHFDIGLTAGGINFGASPGDEDLPLPYLYVGPHAGPPRRDAFWNAPFGATIVITEVHTPAEADAFFREARRRLAH